MSASRPRSSEESSPAEPKQHAATPPSCSRDSSAG
eukprot:CAMPEP_0183577138 /NCGR_PEP_ID=MMETSP0371-20130417/139213_1 /TAXON_ID=268820 /ORGANISM="Peridinium aciculiferum, Strain PAER-2" /LENGTH=34 /DNA_ID= /DNA_START= /DNA_END= /DNA_ORIENTATION=